MKKIYLNLNTRDEFLRIDISKIIYFEADGNYTNIVLANQLKGVVCMNLAHMQQVLSDNLKEQASRTGAGARLRRLTGRSAATATATGTTTPPTTPSP